MKMKKAISVLLMVLFISTVSVALVHRFLIDDIISYNNPTQESFLFVLVIFP